MTAALAAGCLTMVGFTLAAAVVFIVAAFTDPAPPGVGLDILNPRRRK